MVMLSESPSVPPLLVEQEIVVRAPVSVVFESLLEELGPEMQVPGGHAMPMVLEAWPGGRWFRDLGKGAGHFWGHVQVIKPPSLLELAGPLFMSYPGLNHVQYRLTAEGTGTRLKLTHRAIGEISSEHRSGVVEGWKYGLERVRHIAESKGSR